MMQMGLRCPSTLVVRMAMDMGTSVWNLGRVRGVEGTMGGLMEALMVEAAGAVGVAVGCRVWIWGLILLLIGLVVGDNCYLIRGNIKGRERSKRSLVFGVE